MRDGFRRLSQHARRAIVRLWNDRERGGIDDIATIVIMALTTAAVVGFFTVMVKNSVPIMASSSQHQAFHDVTTQMKRDASHSRRVEYPATDIHGNANADHHEVAMYTVDDSVQHHAYFWSWYYDSVAGTIQRYAYDDPNTHANLAADSTTLTGVHNNYAGALVAANALPAPLFGGTAIQAATQSLGLGMHVTNTVVELHIATDNDDQPIDLLPGTPPTGFSEVVGGYWKPGPLGVNPNVVTFFGVGLPCIWPDSTVQNPCSISMSEEYYTKLFYINQNTCTNINFSAATLQAQSTTPVTLTFTAAGYNPGQCTAVITDNQDPSVNDTNGPMPVTIYVEGPLSILDDGPGAPSPAWYNTITNIALSANGSGGWNVHQIALTKGNSAIAFNGSLQSLGNCSGYAHSIQASQGSGPSGSYEVAAPFQIVGDHDTTSLAGGYCTMTFADNYGETVNLQVTVPVSTGPLSTLGTVEFNGGAIAYNANPMMRVADWLGTNVFGNTRAGTTSCSYAQLWLQNGAVDANGADGFNQTDGNGCVTNNEVRLWASESGYTGQFNANNTCFAFINISPNFWNTGGYGVITPTAQTNGCAFPVASSDRTVANGGSKNVTAIVDQQTCGSSGGTVTVNGTQYACWKVTGGGPFVFDTSSGDSFGSPWDDYCTVTASSTNYPGANLEPGMGMYGNAGGAPFPNAPPTTAYYPECADSIGGGSDTGYSNGWIQVNLNSVDLLVPPTLSYFNDSVENPFNMDATFFADTVGAVSGNGGTVCYSASVQFIQNNGPPGNLTFGMTVNGAANQPVATTPTAVTGFGTMQCASLGAGQLFELRLFDPNLASTNEPDEDAVTYTVLVPQ